MERSTPIVCAVLMASLAVARGAAAAPTVRWHAPEECPATGYVSGDDRDVEADVTIDRTSDGRYRTSIKTRRGRDVGERTLESGTCAEATEAAALIVAMLAGPTPDAPPPGDAVEIAPSVVAATPTPPQEPQPETRTETPPEVPRAPPEAPRETPTESPAGEAPRTFDLALLGLGDVGSLPRTGLGVTIAAGMRIAFARIEASASHLPAQTADSAEPGKGGRVSLSAAGFRAGIPFGRALEIIPAAGIEVGSIAGEGFGVRRPLSDSALWLGIVAGAAVRWPARGRFGLRGGVDAVIPLGRKEFQLADSTVHLAGAVVGRATLGVQVEF